MHLLLLAACTPDGSSAAPDPVVVSVELSDGREVEGEGVLYLVEVSAAISAEPCLDSVEVYEGTFGGIALALELPAWDAEAAVRSRGGDQEDAHFDDGGIFLDFDDGTSVKLHGVLTISSTSSKEVEVELTEGLACTQTDSSEDCVAIDGTLVIDGSPIWMDEVPYSTGPGRWEHPSSAEPYCSVYEWKDPSATDE